MNQKYDFIIIGQGIAGSCLAYTLLQQGFNVAIVTSPSKPNASRIAGGLMQRISGRYLSLPKLIQDHFSTAISFYKHIQNKAQQTFLYPYPTYRIVETADEHARWDKKQAKPEYQSLMSKNLTSLSTPTLKTHQVMTLYDTYVVDTEALLDWFQHYFISQGCLFFKTISEADISITPNSLKIQNLEANVGIFCLGSALKDVSLFQAIPFTATKGDILSININYQQDYILQHDTWLIPFKNHNYKFGATYSSDTFSLPSQKGYVYLTSCLNSLGYTNYQVTSIHSAHRCALPDHFPCIGFLPNYPHIGVFGGFGSKGFITAPALAEAWTTSFLLFNNTISSIQRFF